MERVVKKFASMQEADAADEAIYRQMNGQKKLEIFLELIAPEISDEAVIERSVRVYPLAQCREG